MGLLCSAHVDGSLIMRILPAMDQRDFTVPLESSNITTLTSKVATIKVRLCLNTASTQRSWQRSENPYEATQKVLLMAQHGTCQVQVLHLLLADRLGLGMQSSMVGPTYFTVLGFLHSCMLDQTTARLALYSEQLSKSVQNAT